MDNSPSTDDGTETLERLDRFLSGDPAVTTTLLHELKVRGLDVVEPASVQDENLANALTEVVRGLFDMGAVIEHSDHLTDRELYVELWEYLNEAAVVFPDDPDMTVHWSPIGGCSEEDIEIYHRYFANERERESWMEQFPEYVMPPSELPPHPRPWIPRKNTNSR